MQPINRYIEQTLIKPDLKAAEIGAAISECVDYRFAGLCVPPAWAKMTKSDLGNSGILLVSIAGFPFGYSLTETKLDEISRTLDHGADEIDMVWNLSAFKSGSALAKTDIARCCESVHSRNRVIKIIIETCYLSHDEIRKACALCADAGADFVKTSTGFGPAGADPENVRLMRSVLPSHIGVKAAGGIRDYHTAAAMIGAGADRIGTSSGAKIMKEAPQTV